ncbi:MAG TPA: HlyD family efflux transporter periplasmic adaptor subunit, partial [Methylomirabilota bacterium]|nr:HlyD family efflux transporter periplasmic adaptor subunit [Methylomirabilota bacterium]
MARTDARPHGRWLAPLALLLAVLAMGLGVWWWQRAREVSVTRPLHATIVETIASSGRVRGVTETLAGVQAAGVVERLFVREGDRVSAGQRLAILKNDVAEARVAQAEAALTTAQATLVQVARGALPSELEAAAAQVQQARAQLAQQRSSLAQAEQSVVQAEAQLAQHQAERELAARQLERAERLLERGLIARAEHDQAVTRSRVSEQQVTAQRQAVAVAGTAVQAFRGGVAAAEANVGIQEARLRTLEIGARPEDVAIARQRVREAERALAVARRQAQEAVVVAPFGGVVTAINAEVGQTVGSQGVLQLVSTEMEIRVEVDETNLADLALGQSAVVSSSTFLGSTFGGTVREIGAAVDQTRGTVTVTIAPVRPPVWLRPGQTVNVNIVTNPAAPRLLVPAAALRRVGDRTVVLVVRDGRALEQVVQTRPPTKDGVPVVTGL